MISKHSSSASDTSQQQTQQQHHQQDVACGKIRFAPLPKPTGSLPAVLDPSPSGCVKDPLASDGYSRAEGARVSAEGRSAGERDQVPSIGSARSSFDSQRVVDEASVDDSDSEYDSDDGDGDFERFKRKLGTGSKSKW